MFHPGHDYSDEEETELADKSEKGSEDKDDSFEGNQLDEDDNDNEADNDYDNEGIVPQSGKITERAILTHNTFYQRNAPATTQHSIFSHRFFLPQSTFIGLLKTSNSRILKILMDDYCWWQMLLSASIVVLKVDLILRVISKNAFETLSRRFYPK